MSVVIPALQTLTVVYLAGMLVTSSLIAISLVVVLLADDDRYVVDGAIPSAGAFLVAILLWPLLLRPVRRR